MAPRSRFNRIAGAAIARYPRQTCLVAFVLPWTIFACSSPAVRPSFALYEVALLTTVGAALVVNTVRLGFLKPRIWSRVVALYGLAVNVGLAEFSYIYWSLSDDTPSAFSEPLSRIDSTYLTLATFTTTGFGDVVPRSPLARLVITGQMALTFVAIVAGLAILLAARPGSPAASADEPEPPSDGVSS